MNNEPQKQYPDAKRAWEQRTGCKTVAFRLGADARERLERLADQYGGNRETVEAALLALERENAAT